MEYYTPEELAEKLKVTRRAVYKWLKEKRLNASKFGGKIWRISEADLEAFYESERPGKDPEAAEPSEGENLR